MSVGAQGRAREYYKKALRAIYRRGVHTRAPCSGMTCADGDLRREALTRPSQPERPPRWYRRSLPSPSSILGPFPCVLEGARFPGSRKSVIHRYFGLHRKCRLHKVTRTNALGHPISPQEIPNTSLASDGSSTGNRGRSRRSSGRETHRQTHTHSHTPYKDTPGPIRMLKGRDMSPRACRAACRRDGVSGMGHRDTQTRTLGRSGSAESGRPAYPITIIPQKRI